MGAMPKNYDRNSFIDFLRVNNVNSEIIERFMNLPESIGYKDATYVLSVTATYHNSGGSYYTFELNYYAEEVLEYLLSYKIFQDIEQSIDRIECELLARNLVDINFDIKC